MTATFVPTNGLDYGQGSPCTPTNEWCRQHTEPHTHGDYTCDRTCPCWGLLKEPAE